MTFDELGLNPSLIEAISYMGYKQATPIQERTIPIILENKDLIACAQTGTGKTAAFLLPILNKLIDAKSQEINTLIIVPTRELAIQIDQQINGLGYFISVDSIAIYGGGSGTDWEQEKKALISGTNIIVATPGKLIAHLQGGYVNFDQLQHVILDEADRMLDIGFYEDIVRILSYLPKKRQSLLFSATMAPKVKQLADKLLNNPVQITTALSKPAKGVEQQTYLVYTNQKVALLNLLMSKHEDCSSIIVFCSTKRMVHEIYQSLKRSKHSVNYISSDLEQKEREAVLANFAARNTRILIATDVISRGIDIKNINLIINFDVPGDAEDYVHRVGRTARAETQGIAITLINPEDMPRFDAIEKLIEQEIPKQQVPKEVGESPIWRVDATLPPKGYRPKKKFFKKKPGASR